VERAPGGGPLTIDIFLTSYVPNRGNGRGVRSCSVIAALARLGEVEVVYVPHGAGAPAADLAAHERVTLRRLEPSRGPARLLTAGWALAAGATWDLARAVSPEVMRAARAAPPNARLIADGPTAAAAVLPLARRERAVYLAHNLESSFRGGPRLARFERRVVAGFGEAWMATPTDVEAAHELAGGKGRLRYVPNVVDVTAMPAADRRPGNQVVLFVGDFTYGPNREGLAFLVDQVMPAVWRELPEASVDVVGRGLDTPPADPRVRALGFVDDLDAAYAAADAAVVPLLAGGGSPLKFVEALAHGLPVVATSHAAALIGHGQAGEHFLAAADAESLAAALVSVLRGEADGLGPRGRSLAEQYLSVDALARQLGA
jgi:glycosyltransferase involved in cell wall biosynthesis